jgi:hypothetical protein
MFSEWICGVFGHHWTPGVVCGPKCTKCGRRWESCWRCDAKRTYPYDDLYQNLEDGCDCFCELCKSPRRHDFRDDATGERLQETPDNSTLGKKGRCSICGMNVEIFWKKNSFDKI